MFAGLMGVATPEDTYAKPCPVTRYECNPQERYVRETLCPNNDSQVSKGVIWFNTSGDLENNTTGYYASTVEVSYSETSVPVKIRGSVFACGNLIGGAKWASHVQPGFREPYSTTPDIVKTDDDRRLSVPPDAGLYRGDAKPGFGNRWSSQGGEVNATLDVTGIAEDNANGTDTQTIVINLFRCFSTDGDNIVNGGTVQSRRDACYSNEVVVTVVRAQDPSEYELIPAVTIESTIVEPGDSVETTNIVTNSNSDPSGPTIWRLTKMIYSPSTILNSNFKKSQKRATDPCATYVLGGRTSCDTVQELTDAVFNPGPPRAFDPVFMYDVPADAPVGTKICFTASVNPYSNRSSLWRHSVLQCMTVGKKPKLQVWGGDVRAGGKINTSTVTSASSTYGSWAEYAALSIGNNNGFASGSGLNNGNGSAVPASWSKLTFANTGESSGCSFGCFDFTLSSPALTSQFVAGSGATGLSGTVNLNTYNGIYTANNLRISASSIGSGRTVIILARGEVTIEGDIIYEDRDYSSIRDIPQVIIRAPTINIRNSAGRVDAWLLAVNPSGGDTGIMNTCSNYGTDGKLATDRCNNKLVINGPVVADTVYLRRTGGSESQPDQRDDPAEVFNLRADAYLWAYAYGSGTNRVQTVYTKELSPRF